MMEYEHGFACNAIRTITKREDSAAYKRFASLYKADGDEGRGYRSYVWWDYPNQEVRIIALLLAAEIVRTNCMP